MNKQNILASVITSIVVVVVALMVVGGNNQPQGTEVVDNSVGYAGTRFSHGISIGTNTAPASNGLKIGDNGTEVKELISISTCVVDDYNTIQRASSTKAYSCPVTGVSSGDIIIAQIATSTAPGGGITFMDGLWSIVGAMASTTDGYATVLYRNDGPAKRPSDSGIASSTTLLVIDN